jgi:Raf kinase inhibitor-like YbhB/YbcL family protein
MLKRLSLLSLILFFVSGAAIALTLTSSAFKQGESIPTQFTCDGVDHSPALSWTNAPANTQSFALIMDDPDAPMGTWDHWILYNIPATTTSLAENIQTLPTGTQIGSNSWKRSQYNGPCPPDREHRYFFKLYALDTTLKLPDGASKADVQAAMNAYVLGTAELMGKYNRPQNKK